jgi:hypothetical protein
MRGDVRQMTIILIPVDATLKMVGTVIAIAVVVVTLSMITTTMMIAIVVVDAKTMTVVGGPRGCLQTFLTKTRGGQ